jgi:hypothetical protein
MLTNEQTDMTKLIATFHDSVNAPKKYELLFLYVLTHNLSYIFAVLDYASQTPSVELQAHYSNSAVNWQLYQVTTFILSKQYSHLRNVACVYTG